MTDTTAAQGPPPPVVSDAQPQEVARNVYVIPDGRVPLVPNVGIIVGDREALVVDTGMGIANGRRVLARARSLTDKPLVLTITHFHPEHGYGARVFADEGVRIVYNRSQYEELTAKGRAYLEMFRTFGDAVAEQLQGVDFAEPDELYDDRRTLDLGGLEVELVHFGLAHTRGDQVIFLPEQRVLFAGDLLENRIFPIVPWFPPDDVDVNGSRWIEVLDRLEELGPAVVVPGHGEVTGPELIDQVRSYLQDVRSRVRSASGTLDEVKAALEPAIRADYPGWDAPEWIGFAVECFHAELHG